LWQDIKNNRGENMQRDMDLVRHLLRWMADQPEGSNVGWKIEIEGYTDEQIGYHAYLMHQANLMLAVDCTSLEHQSPRWMPLSLTWAGHDFLESVSDETLWSKAKKNVIQPAGGVAFNVLLDWIKAEAKARLGLS
jgi:hypothetical protein